MKLAFSTLGCPDWPIEKVVEKARQYGYDGVELRTHPDGKHLSPDVPPEKARELAKSFRDAGVRVFALSGYAEYSSRDPAKIRANEELTRKLVALANIMGATMVRVYGGRGEEGEDLARVAERVARVAKPLAEAAHGQGVRLAIETHDAWNRGTDLIRILDRAKSPGLTVCFDIHNTLHVNHEWQETYSILKTHIGYCHMKDACPGIEGGSGLVMVGAGELPLREILRALKKDKFTGYLSFEWEKRWCPELEAPERVFPQYLYKMREEWGRETI